MFIAVPATQF